ncbi:MAG: glycosyltransferase family 4 protein [Pirellula sp.]|jgi:glycosyltransferase involved in cell wall biosynthesis
MIGRFGGGGAERLAYNLALALAETGAKSICIAVRDAGGYAAQGGVPVEVHALSADRSIGSRVRAALRLRKLLINEKVDVLHVHGSSTIVLCYLVLRTMWRRPQVWFTWHDSGGLPEGSQYRDRIVRRAIRSCQRIFGSSQGVADRLQTVLGGNRRVEVFRNGVPMRDATERCDSPEPNILWLARMVPTKDPQIVIRAAARLATEGLRFKLIMAGDALPAQQAYADETRKLAERLGIADRVQFPGWLDDVAIDQLYREGAIGVQSSLTEGLSMTLLEQMMAGLAIVATDVGDTRVAIVNEQTGLLISATDEPALTHALRRLVIDIPFRCRLAATARQQATAYFSLKAMATTALRLLGSHDER